MDDLQQYFSENGALARSIANYAAREEQQRMADEVSGALETGEALVVEAGTGTGKTYAYLVPALVSGQKIIISTGTKHLQDQLFHRDLPVVREALGLTCTVALLKGRSNYLCLHRKELFESEGRSLSRKLGKELRSVTEWAGQTVSGDLGELSAVPEDSSIRPRITSNTENCLGPECDFYDRCFVVKARAKAQEADLLVVNHHLLCADMVLKEEGFGDLLPGADAIVLDEAHQLPEIASQFFSVSLSSRQLFNLVRDVELEHIKDAGDMRDLPEAARGVEKAVLDTRIAFGQEGSRGAWVEAKQKKELTEGIDKLKASLTELNAWLELAAPRSKGLDGVWKRSVVLEARLQQMSDVAPDGYIHWYETGKRSFSLHFTPMDVAEIFQEKMETMQATWVFTSATLAVCQKFDHFCHRMGLQDPQTLLLDSPFDYQKNALLYLPRDLPEPNSSEYNQAIAELALELISLSEGRIFLLFTSHRALREVAEYLDGKLDYPMYVQGQAPRSELLDRFRESGNAVLLGTSSFWEGVDVRGSALSCVFIDKLPFASPGDPVLQGRIDAMKARGGNPFMEYQLPHAVIALKQGIGRLIRDRDDRGVLVLCDPRIKNKSYGRIFLKSLPEMPGTDRLDDVEEFFVTSSEQDDVTDKVVAGAS